MAAIWYRRDGKRVSMLPPLRDDWEAVRPWTAYRRVWVLYRCAYMGSTTCTVDEQLVQ